MSIRCRIVYLIAVVLLAANAGRAENETTRHWITQTIPPIREGEFTCSEGPDDARILRALPQAIRLPGVFEQSRGDIQIVTECIVDKIDLPRCYPLVGSARMHHSHWKCTVCYNETIRSSFPLAFRRTQPRVQVVYIDLDHLHLAHDN
jgi:hypothetical protein